MRLAGGAMVLIVVIAATAFGLGGREQEPYAEAARIADSVRDFNDLQKRFQDLSREKGAEYAFEILRRAEHPPNTDLHLLGHSIGEIMYEQKGVAGIADCTQDFRNACSHSIVIGALNDFGETALEMIRDSCRKAPGGSGAYTMCYHGLGHGVFAYFSYDLVATVDFCRKTGTSEYRNREYIECVGGAIMELMSGGGHDRDAWLRARERYLDPDRPLAPCMDAVIPKGAKIICLTYLTPHLWELAGVQIGNPDPAIFPEAFAHCDVIPYSRQELRDACFGGFGKEFVVIAGGRDVRDVAAFSDDTFLKAIEWCGYAAADDGKRACVSDAVSSVFWGGENDPEAAFRFCGIIADTATQNACYARLASAISTFTQGEERARLCARIPEIHQKVCAEK
ncbi:MAG: hypothetical protein WA021_03385 [Minisyncoccia bacterium]